MNDFEVERPYPADELTREQVQAQDDDIAHLRELCASALTTSSMYRIRGIAHMLGKSPSSVLNTLLADSDPALGVVLAAVALVRSPSETTTRVLVETVRRLEESGGPRGLLAKPPNPR